MGIYASQLDAGLRRPREDPTFLTVTSAEGRSTASNAAVTDDVTFIYIHFELMMVLDG